MGSTRRRTSKKPRFVIQEHHARSLHWDFRLEHEGVLVSWALPKGLPENPKVNRLAVHTEDHPLDYGTFEGEIPKGEYGAGRVAIWDSGTFELECWDDKEVKFRLLGAKAQGRFVLFKTRGTSWMIHKMDEPKRPASPLPTSLKPMLAVAGELPKDDEGWAYETKWDGIRAIVFVDHGRVRVASRNEKDLTALFPELRSVGDLLGSRACVLDGEIVSLGPEGRPAFHRLQHRLQLTKPAAIARLETKEPAMLVVFDVLHLDGESLLEETYDRRRSILESLKLSGPSVITGDSFRDRRGSDVLRATFENELEGVVAKRRDSPYRPGQRRAEWTKIKNLKMQEVVLGGWTEGRGERAATFGALLLGIPETSGLRFVGKVGTGFDTQERKQLLRAMKRIASAKSPFDAPLTARELQGVHFLKPKLVGEVRYAEWTSERRLRHPAWRGLREDKAPSDVVAE